MAQMSTFGPGPLDEVGRIGKCATLSRDTFLFSPVSQFFFFISFGPSPQASPHLGPEGSANDQNDF